MGVGGAGVSAVNHMIDAGIRGVVFEALDTDAESLSNVREPSGALLIGETVTRGSGSSGDVEAGRRAAEESRDRIRELLKKAPMVLVIAGMGGGTGSGAAPVIAEIARHEVQALTIGLVTYPFQFEGMRRRRAASAGIEALRPGVDTLIAIPYDRLLELTDKRLTLSAAYALGDDILCQGVRGLTEMLTAPTLMRRDFADVRAVMREGGCGLIAIGRASGENRAAKAVRQAIANWMPDVPIDRAQSVLLSACSDSSIALPEMNEIASIIREATHPDANLVFNFAIDKSLGDEIKVTLMLTGFDSGTAQKIQQRTAGPPRCRMASLELDLPTFFGCRG